MNPVDNYVMPEPPQVEGIDWTQDQQGNWWMVGDFQDLRPTDADLLDDKCSAMDQLNRYYR